MNITDCNWEIDNIGLKTIQLDFENNDDFAQTFDESICSGNDYVVARVPAGNVNCLMELQKNDFRLIEMQMVMSKLYKDFDFEDKRLKLTCKNFYCKPVITTDDLKDVLDKMTPNMFSTDRIHLDSQIGPEKGLQRYRNWVKTEFFKDTTLFEYGTESEMYGFNLLKINNSIAKGYLGGLYENFQGIGLGLLTPASTFLYCRQNNIPIKKMTAAISSNNVPVLQMYNCLKFNIESMCYVLIKHMQ